MTLPLSHGKNYQIRLISLYKAIYKKRTGENPAVNYKIFAPILKRLMLKYGEMRVACGLLLHFEQANERIGNEGFNPSWVYRSMDKYMQQLVNLEVDVDSEEELYSALKNRLEFLDIPFAI